MREFFVVSTALSPVPAVLRRTFDRPEVAGSLLRARHRRWLSTGDNRTAVAFRYLEPPAPADPNRFFDGLAVRKGRLTRDEQSLPPDDTRDFAETARGVFSLVSVEDHSVRVVCDPLSLYPIWYWKSEGLFICSNNTHLIGALLAELGISVEKDPTFFAWELAFGNNATNSTGYRGINWVPFGHYIEFIHSDASSQVTMRQLKWIADDSLYRSDLTYSQLIDHTSEEIAENVAVLTDGDFATRVCDLSGGLDTRLLLAAVLNLNRSGKYYFSTWGNEAAADGNVAAALREQYDLRRGIYAFRPPLPSVPFSTRLRSMLFRTYGCFSQLAGNDLGRRSNRDLLHFNGGCGETFRSFYQDYGGSSTLEQRLIAQLHNRGAVIRRDVREEIAENLKGFFAEKTAAGFDPIRAGDQYYIEHRNRQFVGTQCRANLNTHSAAYPLYSLAGITAAFSAPGHLHQAAPVHFHLIDRLYPELLEVPLEGRRWDPQVYKNHVREPTLASLGPVDPGDRRLASPAYEDEIHRIDIPTHQIPGEPVRPTAWEQRMRSEKRHWSWVHLDSALSCLRRAVSRGESLELLSAAFDPDALKALASRDLASFTGSAEVRRIYHLYSAALWLSNEELIIPLEGRQVVA